MNEIAVVEQLPVIKEKIKEIGENLDKRIKELKLDELVCNEETRKDIKQLRTDLGKEFKEFEVQRKDIKTKINKPYEEFNKVYEEQIKAKYANADTILANKVNEVESKIKHETLDKMQEFFNEYKASKTLIKDDYLSFSDLDMTTGLNLLTDKGMLVKKVKDEIIEKVDSIENDLKTINALEHSDEVLVEYLKHKDLGQAIRDVNDRHMILDTIKQSNEEIQERVEQEEKVVEQVEEVLQAPQVEEKKYSITFKVFGTKEELTQVKQFLENGGYRYEQQR